MAQPPLDILDSLDAVELSLTVLALRGDATPGNPDYNFESSEEIVLSRSAFASYGDLYRGIEGVSSCGYLKEEFFRIALFENYKSGSFLTSEQISQLDLSQTVCLVLVRYNKQQALQLRSFLTSEEQQIMEDSLRFKRTVVEPPRKFPQYIKRASMMINNQPPSIFDAYARTRRICRASECHCWKISQYLYSGLIDMQDIDEMEEEGIEKLLKIEKENTSKHAEVVLIDVPEFLVIKVQKMIARHSLGAQMDDLKQ